MSLDIYLTDRETGDEIRWMNWPRNPFGLERWVRDNTGVDLWHVVNDHAYDDSANVDRAAFLAKAREAVAAVAALDVGRLRLPLDWGFADATTRDLIAHRDVGEDDAAVAAVRAPGAAGAVDAVRHPGATCSRTDPASPANREWLDELLAFAEDLQNPAYDYYCSN